MEVVCTPEAIAYHPNPEEALSAAYGSDVPVPPESHPFRGYVVRQHDLVGGDGAGQLVPAGCGRTFTVPDDAEWDVNTNEKGLVVERHLSPTCPHCGAVADFLSEPVDPPAPLLRRGAPPTPDAVPTDDGWLVPYEVTP